MRTKFESSAPHFTDSIVGEIDYPLELLSSVLHYTFSLPDKERLQLFKKYFVHPRGNLKYIETINPFYQELIKSYFELWSTIAAVSAKEFNPDEYDGDPSYIFQYTDNKKILGYVRGGPILHYTRLGMGISSHLHSIEKLTQTIIHEIGHVYGLQHPFAQGTTGFQKLSTFSIMNYMNEIDEDGYKLFPITPMPADMDAIQRLHGANLDINKEDNLYLLRYFQGEISPKKRSKHRTISSLPWDNGGVDTISAEMLKAAVVRINIRPYGRTKLQDFYVVTPNYNVENVIGGSGKNDIILNGCDNIIDVRHSTYSRFWIDAKNSAHDTLIGFYPGRDQLIFEYLPGEAKPDWILQEASAGTVSICGETVNYSHATLIFFNTNNTVLLTNVLPYELNSAYFSLQANPCLRINYPHQQYGICSLEAAEKIVLDSYHPPENNDNDTINHVFNEEFWDEDYILSEWIPVLLSEIVNDITESAYRSMLMTLLFTLVQDLLKTRGFARQQIDYITFILFQVLMVYNNWNINFMSMITVATIRSGLDLLNTNTPLLNNVIVGLSTQWQTLAIHPQETVMNISTSMIGAALGSNAAKSLVSIGRNTLSFFNHQKKELPKAMDLTEIIIRNDQPTI